MMARPPITPPTIPAIGDFFFVLPMTPDEEPLEVPDDPLEEAAAPALVAAVLSSLKVKAPAVPWEEVGMITSLVAARLEPDSVSYTFFHVLPSFSPEYVVSKRSNKEEKVESQEKKPMDACGTK
jgi:hypothetical protein